MKYFYTVVQERMATFTEDFDTEPYECGWASEAIFFIRVHEINSKKTNLDFKVQVSADGIEWIDEGTVAMSNISVGSRFVKVRHFGGWLRLSGTLMGEKPEVRVTIHLVLKE